MGDGIPQPLELLWFNSRITPQHPALWALTLRRSWQSLRTEITHSITSYIYQAIIATAADGTSAPACLSAAVNLTMVVLVLTVAQAVARKAGRSPMC